MQCELQVEKRDFGPALVADCRSEPGKRLGRALDGIRHRRNLRASSANIFQSDPRQGIVGEAKQKILQRRLSLILAAGDSQRPSIALGGAHRIPILATRRPQELYRVGSSPCSERDVAAVQELERLV